MGTPAEREGVREAFRNLLLADMAKGEVKDLGHYKGLFPGFWDVVGEEFDAIAREGQPGVPPAASGPSLAPPKPGPEVVATEALPGNTVERIGPYRILRELGRGGMGVVFLAEDTRIGRRVALKVLAAHFSSSRHLLLRFQREAELAGKLDHPHICTVYEAGEADGTAYMAMRLVEGKPLSEWIDLSREAKRPSGVVTLPPLEEGLPGGKAPSDEPKRDLDRILQLVEKAARALHVAHEKGLIHRDVKPQNIMVTEAGEPVLLDFGLAREQEGDGQQLTRTGSLMGTPAYMSPEQLTAARDRLDRRTDVYSLGATLYECLTLRLPFEAPTLDGLYQKILTTDPEDPRRLNGAIPRDLEVVVATALEKDRARRYQTSEAFAEDLRRVREHEPIAARPAGPLLRLWRWAQRRPATAASVTVAFLALAGGLAVSQGLLEETRRERNAKEEALGRSVLDNRAKGAALEESGRSLRTARTLALVSASREAQSVDNRRALLLAREAVRLSERSETVSRLHEVAGIPQELALLRGHGKAVWSAAISPDGTRLLTGAGDRTARLWDLAGKELAVLRGHESGVVSAVFSPDGTRVLTWSGWMWNWPGDHTARLYDLTGKELAVLRGHGGGVLCAKFSPDGTRIVTGSHDGTGRLWDLSGRELAVLRGHGHWVVSAVFSPDGTRILTASEDSTARLWDTTGKELAVFRQGGAVRAAAFSPDGTRVLTGAGDGTARLWDLPGREIAVLRGHAGLVSCVAFSPDGTRVLTGSEDGTGRLWDLAGKEIAVLRGHDGAVTSAVFSPDGTRALTRSGFIPLGPGDRTARLWDMTGKEVAVLRGHERDVLAVAFSPDGTAVLTGSEDGTARLWDVTDREVPVLRGHGSVVVSAAFSPDGTAVVTAGAYDRTARLWDAAGRETAVLRGHGKEVFCAAFTPDGSAVLTGSQDCTGRLWDLAGREVAALRGGGAILAADFSPDGTRILTGADDWKARLWDMAGKERAVFRGHEGALFSVAFSPDGTQILTASEDRTARLWDLAGKELAVLRGHGDGVGTAAFSPDGTRLLTASADGTARLWDLAGKEVAVLRGHGDGVFSAAFSPDGKRILTGSEDGTARLWDAAGKDLAILRGHESAVRSAVFSPDGTRVLTTTGGLFDETGDRTARLWDLAGREVAVLRGHEGDVLSAAFSPDGRRVVTGSRDRTARLWLVRTEDLLALIDSRITRGFTPAEREKYRDLLPEAEGGGK